MTNECHSAKPLQLNLGCGPVQPQGWLNIDGSNRARLASRLPLLDALLVRLRILRATEFNRRTGAMDVRKGLPFATNSVAAIYSGEMLEHFTREQGKRLLEECLRVLVPGGVLRIRVPDNYEVWRNYVRDYEEIFRQPREQWNEKHTRWIQMYFDDICTERPWLMSMGHYHKWMYDEVSLILAFQTAGFVEVERRKLHDSRIPDIASVETRGFLTVEGIKPVA